MIAIVDYGCGNVNAFVNAFKRINLESNIVSTSDDLVEAKKIILPGVGSFDHVIKSFNNSGLRDAVEEKVFKENIDILGVCAGMQIFANSSEEGNENGLGWIDGKVRRFNSQDENKKMVIPHMGWNSVKLSNQNIFTGITNDSRFYFVHSYYFDISNDKNKIGATEYGKSFCSAVREKNIYGVQFHPEKSHDNGQKLLSNFIKI